MKIFHLTPNFDNGIQIEINEIDFAPNAIVCLGTGKTIMNELSKSGISPSRKMIKEAIAHKDAFNRRICTRSKVR